MGGCLQTHSLCPQTPATAPWASPPCPIAASPPQPSSSSTQPRPPACTTSPQGWTCRAGPPQLTPLPGCLPSHPSCSWTCCRPPTSLVGAARHVDSALPHSGHCAGGGARACSCMPTRAVSPPTGVVVQGAGAGDAFITAFQLQFSMDGNHWHDYRQASASGWTEPKVLLVPWAPAWGVCEGGGGGGAAQDCPEVPRVSPCSQ